MNTRIIFLLAMAAVAATIFVLEKRHSEAKSMISNISDEGYETAQDILYPGKKNRSAFLRYGPVLPGQR